MLQEDIEPKDEQKTQDEAPEPEPEVDPRDAIIVQLVAERESMKDEMIRALAEAQNIQRRLREQHAEAMKFAAEPLVQEILPVIDNFDRTMAAFENGASAEQLLKGVKQVEKQLLRALSKVKVERIDAVGTKFDPELHEALATVESDVHEEETVTSEIDAGYKMHGRVIRPSRVQVTKKP